MTALIVRLVLRYLSGALLALGIFTNEDILYFMDQPEVTEYATIAVAALLGFIAEYWYILAKRCGWVT